MKTGKTLDQLVTEAVRIRDNAKDFIVPTEKLSMNYHGQISFAGHAPAGLNDWSSSQVADFAKVPKAYFDRLQTENKELLAKNVNHGFSKAPNTKRMVRTLDGHVRGFLSDKFRRLDAHDLLEVVLPILMDQMHGFEIDSAEFTERHLYVKATTPKLQGEVKKGDVVQMGVVIRTSDVGSGMLAVDDFVKRLACTNGMISTSTFKKAHVGGRFQQEEREVQELLTDSTKRLSDAAFFSTVRDVLTASLRPEIFAKRLEKLQDAAQQPIERKDLDDVVELSMKATGVTGEGVKKSILNALASGNEGAGLTRWGLANSFTRAAQEASLDYERATELERAGGRIIELDRSDWKKIAAIPA